MKTKFFLFVCLVLSGSMAAANTNTSSLSSEMNSLEVFTLLKKAADANLTSSNCSDQVNFYYNEGSKVPQEELKEIFSNLEQYKKIDGQCANTGVSDCHLSLQTKGEWSVGHFFRFANRNGEIMYNIVYLTTGI